ncbi:uncharacterized protein DS421_14g464230 [Arachis hypogaea]|nr:uncharacterized protein DS421_14g464230 [Arachis hypogaea]
MIEQRKKEIDGGTTTESAFLGYLAIMLFYKSEDSYRGIENTRLAYTPWVVSAALQVKGLLQWFASQVKGLLQGTLPTGKPYLVRGLRVTSGAANSLLNNIELTNVTNNSDPTKNSPVLTPSLSLPPSDGNQPTSAPRSYAHFNLNPVYEIPIVWLLHEVPERRPVEKSDRAEE